ncbi:EscU/YscU/HrcU family type III secretion system export apparatus switch protein [Ideonella sp. BN130291]|uniref:EscU/YscU/HrcU family type III secretion system export apparatus switch protein n=1 Tax=Ideonella sp. BN130291 TaxID=3112940 RepID=UPI002E258EC9|nr:EscU/YscU/HrcU family type III secretion system export apparatus switch protein [Ideonella sp. BN130291]
MAEKDQKPTPKRLRDARKRGEVVFSQDVSSAVSFAVVVAALWALGRSALGLLQALWQHASDGRLLARPGEHAGELMLLAGETLLWCAAGITVIALLGAFAGSFFQVGGLAAWERIKPDVNRLNPAEGFKRIFSTRNLVNLLKMVLKTLLLALLLFTVIRAYIDPALKTGYATPASVMAFGGHALLVVFAWAGVIYAAMAGVDYVHQHHEFMKQQRMSIDDIRREHKETEGDPINQSRRRSAHFEAVYASLVDRVRASSAVIHSARVAVALQYLGEHDLPRVIARGEGDVAATIRRFASEALIPTEFEASLAERLYDEIPIDQPITRALYEPVAQLLRWARGGE